MDATVTLHATRETEHNPKPTDQIGIGSTSHRLREVLGIGIVHELDLLVLGVPEVATLLHTVKARQLKRSGRNEGQRAQEDLLSRVRGSDDDTNEVVHLYLGLVLSGSFGNRSVGGSHCASIECEEWSRRNYSITT